MYVCVLYTSSTWGVQKRALAPLELEVGVIVVRYCVDAENQIWILWESKCC